MLYFNRAFASLVSWAVRTWTWHRYGIYIDIQALQVSLLGGRVFFVGLRYYGDNETFLVQNGHITWSYWLRRVREVDLDKSTASQNGLSAEQSPASKSGTDRTSRLPCRINVSLAGLEWFVYNRSAAYDTVLQGLTQDLDGDAASPSEHGKDEDGQQKLRKRHSRRSDDHNGFVHEKGPPPGNQKAVSPRARSSKSDDGRGVDAPRAATESDELPFMLQLFPIHIECEKAAVVMGNENTRAVLIVKAKGLSGEIDASATDTLDPYRQLFKITFEEPIVEMRENEDFKEDQANRATREKQMARDSQPVPRRSFFRHQRRKFYGQLRNLVPYWRKSVESFSSGSRSPPGTATAPIGHWQGLSRYLRDQDGDERTRWSAVEYAAVNTVIESPAAFMTIYWDAVGKVAHDPVGSDEAESPEKPDNINGAEPPAWGISLSIKGGSVNYGPWADRHRAELQRTFFPGLCKDSKPASKLPVGAYRAPTQFNLYVELEEEVTLRIPVREESKNWRYKGKEIASKIRRARDKRKARARFRKPEALPATAHQRPYGWLDIKVGANATVSFCMDMMAGPTGFSSILNVDLPKAEISSSVNQQVLWRSGPQQISCDLSTPLKWNALREWHFRIRSHDLELFLLRDHIFLLIDLVDDWTSGPPVEYLVFTPFEYFVDLRFENLKLFLNVNDSNIINNPTNFNDNTFLIIDSPLLEATTCIPADKYRPSKNAIPFKVSSDTMAVRLHVPPWNTQAAFLSSKSIGQLENLLVDGSYHYNATTSQANTDTLVLNISGQSPVAHLYGFVIRYFLKLKDNYFGDDIHFTTLEEYQENLRLKEADPTAELPNRPPPKKSNDLDVMLSIRADDPKVLLPANLYSAARQVQLDAASLAADLRFTNYYMDLDFVISPLSLSLGTATDGTETPMSATSSPQLFVDGLHIYGSRLFGLPPTEPTYLCNWDLSVGAVTGECTVDFLTALISGGKAFGFTFDDDENALIPYSAIIMYDVTFLRVAVQSLHIWLHVEEAAFLLSSSSIDVKYNDWARSHYSRRANITIPDLQFCCLNSESAARHKTRSHTVADTDAFIKTTIELAIVGRKFDFAGERKMQQELVRQQDQRTHRTPFLLVPGLLDDLVPDHVDPPAQSVPPIPQPTTLADVELDKVSSISSSETISSKSKSLRHKSSFLSISSSSTSQGSIVRPQSSVRSSLKSRRPGGLQPLTSVDPEPGQNRRKATHKREVSTSTRHSAFYSAVTDPIDRRDPLHNTVAFSSQYFAPYFPLENVRPDTSEARMPSTEQDHDDEKDSDDLNFNLEDIDPDILSQDCVYTSILVDLPEGITAFFNPASIRHAALLVAALQPTTPEDILDSLQIASMSDIFTLQKEQKMKGHIQDLAIRIPRAEFRFLNSPDPELPSPYKDEHDQYDISVAKISLSSRTEKRWEDALQPGSRLSRNSFQMRLGSAEVAASERQADLDNPQAALAALVENVIVSMGSKDVAYFDADIGRIQGNMWSEKIEYLASLIHRTTNLATDLGSVFSETLSRGDRIPGFLVYRLVAEAPDVADPSFLIRPSAVLRSATQHLRTFDAWKLAMRLRQMLVLLKPSAKDQLRIDCLGASHATSGDARLQVVKAFERWRSWDLDDVARSTLLNNAFGELAPAYEPPPATPFLAVLGIRYTQFALDPGPKQNEITFVDLGARFQNGPSTEGRSPVAENEGPDVLSVLNIYCSDARIQLNWELCELVDDVLILYEKVQKTPGKIEQKPDAESTSARVDKRSIHVVVALARGVFVVDTININAKSMCNGLKASLLLRHDAQDVTDTNFIMNCDAVLSRVKSHSQLLTVFRLRGPSVFLSHELHTTEDTLSHTIKATASSRDLSWEVKQDPLVLLETLDVLVRDEVSQLYKLKDQLPSSPKTEAGSKKIADRLSAYRVNVALFLDQYSISLPLLRSLTYTIRGVVARACMAANFGKEVIFDFDVKENSHDMQVIVNHVARSISLLQIPPTNGRITSRMGPTEHSISVFSSLELVQLDASAVYSLLSALNRPEISNAINDLQQQGKLIQSHITEIVGNDRTAVSPSEPRSEKQSVPLVYSVHSTFAGLRIFGQSRIKSETAPLAHLAFCLDSVHVRATNRSGSHGSVLAYPEVVVNLQLISFEIQKGSEESMHSCGSVTLGALITATSQLSDEGEEHRSFNVRSDAFDINLSPETISTVVDVLGYMGDKIKDLDTSRELEYLRKLRQSKPRIAINDEEEEEEADIIDSFLSSVAYSLEIRNIQIAWLCVSSEAPAAPGYENLVLTLEMIEFGTRTNNSARLTIQNLQLQLAPPGHDSKIRSPNSALLPEVIFNIAYVSTSAARRLAFQAVGKSLDLRLTSGFIVPAAHVKDSIGLSIKNVQQASQHWDPIVPPSTVVSPASDKLEERRPRSLLGSKRLESLLVDADFAGAVVHVTGRRAAGEPSRTSRHGLGGKYGQFNPDETGSNTVLRTPGLAWKMEYRDDGKDDPSLYAEVKIDASSNTLFPSVVPLVMDITSSIKEVVSDDADEPAQPEDSTGKAKSGQEDNILTADPSAVLGRVKLNLGLRICKQEFSLSCQPIARVAATASFDDVYFTMNTVRSVEQGNFFAISGTFSKLQAAVQHVYSRESTGSFHVDSIVVSLMNSKHVSGVSGVSAIIKVTPMKVAVNAKQLQDFLLFREIWMPREIRQGSAAPVAKLVTETSQGHLVQRYQQVAATAAFPWTATISISALEISVDLGQALGKSEFAITDFWVSSKKTSDWEQNLCLGFQKIGVDSTGRMSGFVAMQNFKLRTSIQWPEREQALNETPLIQASIGFSQFRVKAGFDYQAFLVADITSMEFLMYNVRRSREGARDRLVASFEGDAVQVFGTTSSAAQGVALYQAFQKLVQERRASFETSLREIEKFMRRKSSVVSEAVKRLSLAPVPEDDSLSRSPISLDTDVVVTLKALNLGVFPSTFSDNQVFKMEALNAQARFAASIEDGRIHSILGLTLGQLRIGLAGVRHIQAPKTLSELAVEDVVLSATGSRGGTILKVPRVEAVMQTWQTPESKHIDYIFKSAFEGKVEVGWNYSRISYIRGMWANHSRSLEQIWGKELPLTAIKVTGVPEGEDDGKDGGGQTKITAEVHVPQSKYEYAALEPAIIETPQLRDMGEATPPLEWIGLHRDRLPNLTHQIVIVSLLELAGEVEDAYSRILGAS